MYVPEIFKVFVLEYPEVADSFKNIGDLCSGAGPMDEKTKHLVQLMQAVLMSGTMIGFPGMIAAYGWVKDVLSSGD